MNASASALDQPGQPDGTPGPFQAPGPAAPPEPSSYLQRILRARVYDVAIESPLDPAPNLSARLGNRVLLKREDLLPVSYTHLTLPTIYSV